MSDKLTYQDLRKSFEQMKRPENIHPVIVRPSWYWKMVKVISNAEVKHGPDNR